jgi:two-component system, OmpR family, KDP operon response regulator KdpE
VTAKRSTGPGLLLVEDDRDLAAFIAAAVREHGYAVRVAASAAEGLTAWEANRPDLILLDLGLPDRDGTIVIRRVRRDAATPILVLSARHLEADRVDALDLGADDYLTKPFGMAELTARIRALLRRAAGPSADGRGRVEIGPLSVDLVDRVVVVADRPVELTAREFEVLKVLVTHAGRLVTHGRLLREVWGTGYSDESHYTHVYVSQIRRKIAAAAPDADTRGLIVAEPGIGYRVMEARR